MKQVRVLAPGSASNLGSGFDCLGVAIGGKGDIVAARPREQSGISVASVSDPRIPADAERNTAALGAAAALRTAGSSQGLELTIEKGLPLAGGMGGSAASAVAGAVAADAVIGAGLTKDQLLEAALVAETVVAGRHGDNVAPSLLGGAVLVVDLDPPKLGVVKVHPSVAMVLVSPDFQVATAEARRVLPEQISRADAVAQAANLSSLILGLERGEADLIRGSLRDRIAEPARIPLYRGYSEAKAAALEAGAWGVCVSGAGPTVLALAAEAEARKVAEAFEQSYERLGIGAVSFVAEVDSQGARIVD